MEYENSGKATPTAMSQSPSLKAFRMDSGRSSIRFSYPGSAVVRCGLSSSRALMNRLVRPVSGSVNIRSPFIVGSTKRFFTQAWPTPPGLVPLLICGCIPAVVVRFLESMYVYWNSLNCVSSSK